MKYLLFALRRSALLLGLLLGLTLSVGPLAAHPARQSEPISLAAHLAYQAPGRAGHWLPVIVELANVGQGRTVQVQIRTGSGSQYLSTVELPSQARKRVMLYAYLLPNTRRIEVRLLDGPTELASQTLPVTLANQRTLLVGLLDAQAQTVRLPLRFEPGVSLVSVPLTLADLPEHPLGLGALDVLVLADQVARDLSAPQLQALEGWVLRGGHLLISGGPDLARNLAGLPASLRPFDVSPTQPDPLLLDPLAPPLPVVQLVPVPGPQPAYALPLAGVALDPAALEQTVGTGRVTVTAFALPHPALLTWERAPQLWAELLNPSFDLPPGFALDTLSADGFVEGNLAATLTALPALQLPPLGPLTALVLIYILMVGPGTYLVLRRLDRLSLGWLVVPGLTLIFAALTYGLGYSQRGSAALINQVTVLEPAAGTEGLARTRSFAGLFSPTRQSYDLVAQSADPRVPLIRPVSIQGSWDNSAPGGGSFGQDQLGTADIHHFVVNQWTMRALTVDSTIQLGPIEAQVTMTGSSMLGEVRNLSELTLYDVVLLQGSQLIRLGDLAPGSTARGQLSQEIPVDLGGFGTQLPVSSLIYGPELERQGRDGGQPPSPSTLQRMRILDAIYSYGPALQSNHPLVLAWADMADLELVAIKQRIDSQRLALITFSPQLVVNPATVELPQGWLLPRFEFDVRAVCFGSQGSGVPVNSAPATMQLVVPRDLYGLQLDRLQLQLGSDSPWSDEVQIQLYDWATGTWVRQPSLAGLNEVAEPARFLGSHGRLRVQIQSMRNPASQGCVYVDAMLSGVMP
ncbi:MAG: hypothetical protein AB4911_22485 [Oscillochloridaceae bacterium umkhey_bin13]